MATTDGFGLQRVRRLDSLDADRTDLFDPKFLVSPSHLMAPTHIHDIATLEKMAHYHADDEVTSAKDYPSVSGPLKNPPMVTSNDFALAFDIDGVFIRGGQPLQEAVKAMRYINGENPWGIKVSASPLLPSTAHCAMRMVFIPISNANHVNQQTVYLPHKWRR